MPIRHDPPLVSALAGELGTRWLGSRVDGLRLCSGPRQAWLDFAEPEGEPPSAAFLLHPDAGHIIGSGAGALVTADRQIPFRRLFLTAVHAPPDERLLVFELAGGRRDVHVNRPPVFRLFVELQTNQWNTVLVDGSSGRIEAVLWPRATGGRVLRPGSAYVVPEGARRWARRLPEPLEWEELVGPVPPKLRRDFLVRNVAWTSSLNVDWVLGDAARSATRQALEEACERYLAVRDSRRWAAWLIDRRGGAQPYPVALGAGARPSDGLLSAMESSARQARVWPASGTDAASASRVPSFDAALLAQTLEHRVRNLRRRLQALERQLEGQDPDRLRDLGHLLLTRRSDVPRGADRAVLEGFDGSPVEIELDPRLGVIENAERYFDRARRRERARRKVPARMRNTAARAAELQGALRQLAQEGPSDRLWKVAGGRPPADAAGGSGTSRGGVSASLPYRRYRSSGGLEIRVGRSAQGNDRLTFRHAAPDDIWLHARQTAGAHVILRWDRRDQNPPAPDLAEAAMLAAIHSEARHSGLVAVDWTRRKHVRKPRKASPGTVVTDRVRTVFVEPDPDAASRLVFPE